MDKNKSNIVIFTPLSLTTSRDPKKAILDNKLEVSKKIVEAVLHCIKFGKSKIVFAELINPVTKEVICLSVDENNFLENLDKNLIILEEYEEYELCAEVIKAKTKILETTDKILNKSKNKSASDLIDTIKNL